MRSARWFFFASVLAFVLAGILGNVFDGLLSLYLVAGGLGALVGSVNAFMEEENNGQ